MLLKDIQEDPSSLPWLLLLFFCPMYQSRTLTLEGPDFRLLTKFIDVFMPTNVKNCAVNKYMCQFKD